jgi:hypothetical protein
VQQIERDDFQCCQTLVYIYIYTTLIFLALQGAPYIYIYIYLELFVTLENLTLYICGPTFGNTESRLFLFAAQCFNIESLQKVFLCHSCV